jgi:hypothetical protein
MMEEYNTRIVDGNLQKGKEPDENQNFNEDLAFVQLCGHPRGAVAESLSRPRVFVRVGVPTRNHSDA